MKRLRPPRPVLRRNAANLVRPLVRRIHPYLPGEQPKSKGIIKLNTNENPYPPSPRVLEAVKSAVDGRLRLYPNASAEGLCQKLADLHRCRAENIIVGNGSDELLALATRAFAEPEGTAPRSGGKQNRSRQTIQFFTPSYSLYSVLAAIHGTRVNAVPLRVNFEIPDLQSPHRGRRWNHNAALTFVTTPNAPSGRGYQTQALERLVQAHKGVIILDEAYVDFARENALRLALEHPHVLVARTFSKAYSLCFLRVGYFVGSPELISALHRIRDSYNVNGLGQVAAGATLDDLPYYREKFRRVIATRERLSSELTQLGFEILPSQTNFLLARPPRFRAKKWWEKLRDRNILVRWFDQPRTRDYLRISIGTDAESDALLRAAKAVLRS